MNQSNKENISNEKLENVDLMQPKDPTKSNALGSHGIKLSVNMTSQDKKEFLLKLEEWRKSRREKFASNVLPKQKQLVKSKVPISSLPHRNKSNDTYVLGKKCDKVESSEKKESVFERLYKNAVKIQNPDTKPSQVKCELRKPLSINLSKTNKPLGVQNIREENKSLYQTNKIITHKTHDFLSSKTTSENKDMKIPHQCNKREVENEDKTENLLHLESLRDNDLVQKEFKEKSPEKQNDIRENKEESINSGNLSNDISKPEITSQSDKFEKTHFIDQEFGDSNNSQILQHNVKVDEGKDLPANSEPNDKNFIPLTEKPGIEKSKAKMDFKINTSSVSKKSNKGMVRIRETSKYQSPLRRSISMIYRKKCKMPSAIRQKCLSEKSLLDVKSSYHYTTNDVNIQSVSHRPNSTYLRNQLEEWLKVNGHSLEGYRHLRCFGITNDEKNLVQQAPTSREKRYSLNSSNCNSASSKTFDDEANKENASDVENWLKELYRLIVELKYPSERCEEWLFAIKKKYETCTKSYLYWECLAALDESKGNIESAVECYEEAIVKGAEVDLVADSLAELFDKMVIEQQKPSKTKTERGLDLKNIFKSTVIKFALQKKTIKELDSKLGQDVQQQLYVATPVRRSSRIKTPCKSHVVNSLHSVTPEVRRNMTFKPNDSLMGE